MSEAAESAPTSVTSPSLKHLEEKAEQEPKSKPTKSKPTEGERQKVEAQEVLGRRLFLSGLQDGLYYRITCNELQ